MGKKSRNRHEVRPPGPHQQSASVTHIASARFEGPLPQPQSFAQYETTLPGAAERILAMAERQAAHRQELELKVIDSNIASTKRGQFLAFVIALVGMAAAIYMIFMGQPGWAIAALVGDLVSMVTVFVIGRRAQEKERAVRREELEGRR